ncbi:prepilin-type N-terminal cleavage/methylation domain-containing protein [Rhodanobacter hydrolyticus]|uniref:Prepilin-type N-terminal cleavage/methylation domain-containing protein n=2 Tax=Rhodanobacter hydrolyticus TaxID=2250595 RepID=A0ABW8J3F4_9GAMM
MHVHRKPIGGFTLLELMIVVAIIAVLLAIAIPSYTDYLTRGKLTEAQNNLAAYRVSMEQYFQDNRNYGTTTTCGVPVPTSPTVKYFTFSCLPSGTGSTATAYTASATGITGTPVANFTFTIDYNNNQQTTSEPTGWGSGTINCWVVRKGGSCQ